MTVNAAGSAERAPLSRRIHAALVLMFAIALAFAGATALAAPNKAPSVTITSPVSGATFTAPATIMIAATATDSGGTVVRVDFYQGSTLIGTRTSAPWTMTWTGVPGGTYSLTAKATDNGGATKTSTAVSVTVTGARIVIAQPAPASVVYGGQAVVSGTFSGDAGSTVVVESATSSRVATLSGSTFSATVPVVVGPNTIRATVARRDRTFDTTSVDIVGNLAPVLAFIAPAASVFDASSAIALEVEAVSPMGTIARVDFYQGATLLGSAATPPYRLNWSGMASGSYTIIAIAIDDRGVLGSAAVPIVVNGPNAPPVVQVTAPAAGATFTAPANVNISANASDPDGTIVKVEFLRDGVVIGLTNAPPYSMTWSNAPAGSYVLAARATDDRTAATMSQPVTIAVKAPNAPPTASLTSPTNGARFVAPATVLLTATATDSDGTVTRVEFLQGSTVIGTASASPFTSTWTNVPAGMYTLTARATDSGGATISSVPVSIVVDANAPPTVALVAPAPGTTFFAPAAMTLSANASDSDGSVVSVEFFQGATSIGTASAPPYIVNWAGVASGTYTLTARATDNGGASTTSSPVAVTVAATGLAFESPVAGATIAAGRVHVQGSVQAPANSGVVVNGVVAALDSGRFYASNVPLQQGTNALTATLTTPDGQAASQSLTVTGAPPRPIVVDVTPTQGLAPLNVAITVTAEPELEIRSVEIDADGDGTVDWTLIASPWEASATYLSAQTVSARVKVTDTAGGVYTETIPIVVVDRAALDQRVRAVWNGMTTALASSDTARAQTYLDPFARQRYGQVFSLLQPDLPQIVETFSTLQGVTLTYEFGEYAVNRVIDGQNRLFLIYFGLNGDGVWRLGAM
jgi:Bacterial Ig domain/Glucodextranase, domain B